MNMNEIEQADFVEVLGGVMEVYGGKLTPTAISIWLAALEGYSLKALRAALSQHVKNSKFAPKPADLLEALQSNDGRPGAEEAWTTCPRSESETAVWTQEAQQAFFSGAGDLIESGDVIAARMAFKEAYERIVREARAAKQPCEWIISQGWDVADRQRKLSEAVTLGRIALPKALAAYPLLQYSEPIKHDVVAV